MTAVIDLDSLGYIVAYAQFVKLDNKVSAEKVKDHVRDFFSSILNAVEATEYCSFYQHKEHKNFRHDIYPEYKAHRGETPEFYSHWIPTITEVFQELNAIPLYTIESDDALSIVKDMYPDKQIVLCHNDKDMYQKVGKHYNIKNLQFIDITKEEAELNLYVQILTGDSTDNILGCGQKVEKIYKSGKFKGMPYIAREGIGYKTALKLLENSTTLKSSTEKIFNLHNLDYNLNEQLIKLLDVNQTYEKLDITFQKNNNLITLNSLFE